MILHGLVLGFVAAYSGGLFAQDMYLAGVVLLTAAILLIPGDGR